MLESSSPVSGDRTLPVKTRDMIRVEEKRKYVEQLRHEIAKLRARISLLTQEINSKQ